MHPDDVAEHVTAEVEELQAGLHEREELGVRRVELIDRFELRIGLTKSERALVEGTIPSGILGPDGGGVQFNVSVPDLGAKPIEREVILRMNCEDFDGQPPTAELLREDGSPLPPEEWPRDLANQGIIRGHQIYGERPFFCRPGLREYHTHPQHEDEPWDRYREALSLPQIALGLLVDLRQRWVLSQ